MIKAEYFIDAEFFESPGVLIPISLGIVSAHDGRELHLVCSDNVDQFRAGYGDPWIEENVMPKLPPREEWLSRAECAEKIAHFIAGTNPQFWAYYAAYDWVCFCWFCNKRIIDLPPAWPRFCFDLKQIMALRVGAESLEMNHSRTSHNALEDARWAVEVWRRLFPSGYRRRP
jgi:hypothetical protein